MTKQKTIGVNPLTAYLSFNKGPLHPESELTHEQNLGGNGIILIETEQEEQVLPQVSGQEIISLEPEHLTVLPNAGRESTSTVVESELDNAEIIVLNLNQSTVPEIIALEAEKPLAEPIICSTAQKNIGQAFQTSPASKQAEATFISAHTPPSYTQRMELVQPSAEERFEEQAVTLKHMEHMPSISLEATPEQNAKKQRVTLHIPFELIERVKNAVYWEPGLTLAGFAQDALDQALYNLEKERGSPFPHRKNHLRGGRPIK